MEAQQAKVEAQRDAILRQIMLPNAKERLSRIAMVKPERARIVSVFFFYIYIFIFILNYFILFDCILRQIMLPNAKERLSRIAMVKPERARIVSVDIYIYIYLYLYLYLFLFYLFILFDSILRQIMLPNAKERLSRIAMVKPERARIVSVFFFFIYIFLFSF